MRVRVYAGHAFSTAGAKGFKKGCNALMRPREKVERRADQLCEGAGPILYRAIPAGLVPSDTGLCGGCGGIMQLRAPHQPPTPLHAGQKGQITARSGAQVGSIGSVLFSTPLY